MAEDEKVGARECHHDESWFKRHKLITWCSLAVVTTYLFTEHRQHVLAFLPYLLLALCPLMHQFTHRDRNQHHFGQHGERGGP